MLLLLAVGIVPFGAIAFWRREKLGLIEAILYRDPQCACCDTYARYLDANGFDVTVVSVIDLIQINRQHGLPEAMDACHTALIGNYIVEGHVPVDIIARLLAEKPDLVGISLPGMPAGTPGMDGAKEGPMTIYSFGEEGQSVFATV